MSFQSPKNDGHCFARHRKGRERILKAGGEVMTLDQLDLTACPECDYHGDKPKTLAIHVGLVHAKLDLMLSDMSLVQRKEQISLPNLRKSPLADLVRYVT